MKLLTATIILTYFTNFTFCQTCEIKCYATQGRPLEEAGFKDFILFLDKANGPDSTITELHSNGAGTIYLDSLTMSKIKNRSIVRFQFRNNLDLEYYRIPKELGTYRRVFEICGKTLIVEPRF